MSLAIFDLDNTLISADSDHHWGEFLVERGVVDPVTFKESNDLFYRDYKAGKLDINAYLKFALEPLTRYSMEALKELHQDFMREKVSAFYLPKGEELVEKHRAAGDTLLVITATNRFVAGPIVESLGVDNLLACEPEVVGGRFTGRSVKTPCYQEGKVTRLEEWLAETGTSMEGSYFYSDSVNDVPLLEKVTHPTAVDPCPRLHAYAEEKGWPIITLRD